MLILSASVHPPETNVDEPETSSVTPPEDTSVGTITFRHAGWKAWRHRVRDALVATSASQTRIAAFDQCGDHAWLAQNKEAPGNFKITCDHCHDRFCVPCTNERSRRTARVIATYIAGKTLRFLTLTLRTGEEPLADSLTRLTAAFRKLRNRPFWKQHVTGGTSLVEIKWNAQSNRWHPHLHIICQGRFMEQKTIAAEWFTVTGDSWIVDIRLVKDTARAAEYVAKYATKGYSSSIFHDNAKLEEAITALAGRRLMMCFGTWRGFSITDPENDETWEQVTSLAQIKSLAECGQRWAVALLQHLANPRDWASPGPMPPGVAQQLGLPPPIIPHAFIEALPHVGLFNRWATGENTYVGRTWRDEASTYTVENPETT